MDLTYTTRGANGQEYGPVPLEQIIAWAREGRVQPQSELKRSDMEYWARAGDFTELQTVLPPGPPAVTAARPAAAVVDPANPAAFARLRSSASWFYWIAGLSLINSIAAFLGETWRFLFGLGITQFIDGMGTQFGSSGKIIVLLLDLIVAGIFVFFGVFAHKRHLWAFIVGMVLFALDALLFLLVQDWLGVGFHAFVLYCLFRGVKACQELKTA